LAEGEPSGRLATGGGDGAEGGAGGGALPQAAVDGHHHLAGAGVVAVLAEPDALPLAQVQFAVTDGHRQRGADEARLHVCRHVVGALTGVSVRHALRDDLVEHHLHVVPHAGVPVLVESQRGGGVQQLYMKHADCKLSQLWDFFRNFISYKVDTPVLWSQLDLGLEPGRADLYASAGGRHCAVEALPATIGRDCAITAAACDGVGQSVAASVTASVAG